MSEIVRSVLTVDTVDEYSSMQNALRGFVAERDWGQFHSFEDLAKSISIEAAELLECFQWGRAADVTVIS